MRPDNAALAQHPDHFDFALSPAKTAAFAAIGVILVLVAIVAVVNLDAINEFGEENASGRRSRALGPYLGYIVAGLGAVLGSWALVHANRTGTWKLTSGQPLKHRSWVIQGDMDNAHQRLATTDPRVYLPLPVSRRADELRRRLRAYTPEGIPVTYLTLTMGAGKNERHWPVLTFEGAAHEAFQRSASKLGKPYQG
ncbi:hypothetical protein [Pseudactinotalea terrae]|uniref:hypothetical protein n=1 Tax=Pseudactinotalea terrae TaxID=1743262 RepID=UPI0012E32173|nr:hypothetical protein [Pseudactinotalea terrae]